ncbi:MAG: DinB family protein [Actinobacteria bacterium]|nr:DinB family protein [Actinomycetota bacterium]
MSGGPGLERREPPGDADERTSLEVWLEFHRATLAMKCRGLDAEQLARRAVPPSPLSLLGLVRHLAELERAYFRRGFAGEEIGWLHGDPEEPDSWSDFSGAAPATAAADLETWREECDRARRVAAAAPSLDSHAAGDAASTLRWTMVKMIQEYARHNGHADLLRECIDGAVGE